MEEGQGRGREVLVDDADGDLVFAAVVQLDLAERQGEAPLVSAALVPIDEGVGGTRETTGTEIGQEGERHGGRGGREGGTRRVG